MNPFRDLPHPAQCLKPVKEMLPQEHMDLVIIPKLSTTLPKMLDPVQACILNLRRKTLLHSIALYVNYKHAGSV